MKKIIALALVLTLAVFCFAACGNKNKGDETPTEKTYSLAIAVEHSYDAGKVTNYAVALVLDADNKIVAVRLDCAEGSLTVTDGAIADTTVTTKVEKGEGYPMTSGTFAEQTKAFETAIIGKTADEVKNLDMATVSGCTMPNSPASFKAVIAKAFASENKATFKTTESFTLGLGINMTVSGGKATAYVGGTVVAGGKNLATVLDCAERSFSVSETGEIVAGEFKGTKVEQGAGYPMTSGTFAEQTKAFENAIVGKTADQIKNLDMATVSGCTMPNSPASFKEVIAKTFANAR